MRCTAMLLSICLFSVFVPASHSAALEAFPGAMGFGAVASGARALGAEVCVVTNLNDDGPGSFRACTEQGPPAYITFAVSGYIDLLSGEVEIAANKTIECATAPGDGVVFRKSRLHVSGDNVILRGCRAWAGSEPGGQLLSVRDGIVVGNTPTTMVHDAIVANSSMMFAPDENGGTYYPVENVTFQRNIVVWGLENENEHGDPTNAQGLLFGIGAARVTAVENFFALNTQRNPKAKDTDGPIEVINNLVYCYRKNGVLIQVTPTGHVIGNEFRRCAANSDKEIRIWDGSVAYAFDNTMSNGSPAVIDVDADSEIVGAPLFTSSVTPIPSTDVEERVFSNAGPAKLIGFEMDAFEHYANGTGGIIESVDDLGGWPTLQGGTNSPDSDGDGMPDWWETAHCGGSCAPTGDHDGDGYENIEAWFHSFYWRRVPLQLDVDSSPLSSNGNGVFEPGEQVEVAPSWRNDGELALTLDGVASDFGGPAGATYTMIAADASYGAVEPGETASCRDTGICYEMGLNAPAGRLTTHWDASFDETLSEASTKTWTLHIGDSFTDVAPTSLFYRAVETMLHRGVTSGCGGAAYCPVDTVNRGQMPVFLLKAKNGPGYLPPACVSGNEQFDDVPASNPLCRWIEELANRGVVSGCGGGDYCPSSLVTRAQMAVFLLKTLEGASYSPPACTGIFNDVACPSLFTDWIEDVYARGIAGGCSSQPLKYCPSGTVNRGQMAVFISNTFGLALYGP